MGMAVKGMAMGEAAMEAAMARLAAQVRRFSYLACRCPIQAYPGKRFMYEHNTASLDKTASSHSAPLLLRCSLSLLMCTSQRSWCLSCLGRHTQHSTYTVSMLRYCTRQPCGRQRPRR